MSYPMEAQIGAIRRYLEWEFPGQVRDTWWDENIRAPVFEVVYETRRHHVIVDTGFIQACQDTAASLRASELADYMREARAQERRFLVLEERGEVHIRSTPLSGVVFISLTKSEGPSTVLRRRAFSRRARRSSEPAAP